MSYSTSINFICFSACVNKTVHQKKGCSINVQNIPQGITHIREIKLCVFLATSNGRRLHFYDRLLRQVLCTCLKSMTEVFHLMVFDA